MTGSKKITISLEGTKFFSPACKVVEMLPGLEKLGYEVILHTGSWGTVSGLTYNSESADYSQGESKFLWDPNEHPTDFFSNLVLPTFKNVKIITESSRHQRFRRRILALLSPFHFNSAQVLMFYASEVERNRYLSQKQQAFLKGSSFLGYLYLIISVRFSLKFKVYPESQPFRYQISAHLVTEKVRTFIDSARGDDYINFLVSANWDDNRVYEAQTDRVRGIIANDVNFAALQRFVKEVDDLARRGDRVRIVLVSKKANDWPSIICSEYIDLRCFEELGFSLSQMIYIAQEITDVSVNWTSTFAVWITNVSGVLHLTWNDDKDTAQWARHGYYTVSPEQAVGIIKQMRQG